MSLVLCVPMLYLLWFIYNALAEVNNAATSLFGFCLFVFILFLWTAGVHLFLKGLNL